MNPTDLPREKRERGVCGGGGGGEGGIVLGSERN